MIAERRRNRGCLSQTPSCILDRYAACRRTPTARPVGRVGHSQCKTGSGGSGRKREAAGISVEHSQSVDRWTCRAAGPSGRSTAGSPWYFCYRTRFGGCPAQFCYWPGPAAGHPDGSVRQGSMVAPTATVGRCPLPAVLSIPSSRRSVTATRVDLSLRRNQSTGSCGRDAVLPILLRPVGRTPSSPSADLRPPIADIRGDLSGGQSTGSQCWSRYWRSARDRGHKTQKP
jgi:hypothetical protein